MIGSKKRGNVYVLRDIDQLAFQTWANTGSLDNARAYFEDKRILHANGRQYSLMGIRYCAMRYMVNCYDEARVFLINSYKKHGITYSESGVDTTLLGYACEILRNRDAAVKWAEKHNLLNETSIAYIEDHTKQKSVESRRAATPEPVR